MTVTYPIGYPTGNPMHDPKGYPNRGRIARPVSYRPGPSPFVLWSPRIISTSYVPRAARVGMMPRAGR